MFPTVALMVLLVATVSSGLAEAVVVTPPFRQIQRPGTATVDCQFPHRLLKACRVRVSDHGPNQGLDSLLDFGNGSQSASVRLSDRYRHHIATASYWGAGLAVGECGLRLEVQEVGGLTILVECLGQAQDGTWRRGFGLVIATRWPVLPSVTITPLMSVVAAHTDVTVMFNTRDGGSLRQCSIVTPSAGEVYLTRTSSLLAAGSRYRGDRTDLKGGECGWTLTDFTQRDAGLWQWWGWQNESMARQATLVLVQAVPEGQPELTATGPSPLVVGSTLNASCRTPPAVPPANITWLLGNEVLRPQSADNDTRPGDVGVFWPWEPSSTIQTLARTLTQSDLGKRLQCRMQHQGMEQDRSVWHDLPVSAEDAASPTPPTRTSGNSAKATCPALSAHSVRVRCSLSDVVVNCVNARAPQGATALLECRPGFKPPKKHPAFHVTNCAEGGQWQPTPLTCDLDCGRRRNAIRSLSVGGKEAKESEFPWHVAIFRREADGRQFQPVCGGSLVTPKFFVSAAHCFWNNQERESLSATLYRVAAGKHSLGWKTRDSGEQRRSIKAIHMPTHFAGYSKRLESDIAVVQLSSPVTVTESVNVVCVHWKATVDDRTLNNTSMGTVPGWGLTENNAQSSTLRFVDLPFVSFDECKATTPLGFQDFLLRDKMCGGYHNRTTSVCTGDSGGGFVFPEGEDEGRRYFLRGVVSSSPGRQGDSNLICQAEHRTAFTKIWMFAHWMEDIVKAEETRSVT